MDIFYKGNFVKIVSFNEFKVLDPFMRLGSSGVACIKNSREFIGYEINNKYFKLAQQNLQKYNKLPLQENLFK